MVDLKSGTLKLPLFHLWAFWVKEIDKVKMEYLNSLWKYPVYISSEMGEFHFWFTFNRHLFMCCNGFLWILNNLHVKSILRSSEFHFSFIESVLVCHLLKIPRIEHLNVSSLINSFFQTDFQPFPYWKKIITQQKYQRFDLASSITERWVRNRLAGVLVDLNIVVTSKFKDDRWSHRLAILMNVWWHG